MTIFNIKFKASLSRKIKDTYVINGSIKIGTYIFHYDVFISEERSGILLDDKFYDFSKGEIILTQKDLR